MAAEEVKLDAQGDTDGGAGGDGSAAVDAKAAAAAQPDAKAATNEGQDNDSLLGDKAGEAKAEEAAAVKTDEESKKEEGKEDAAKLTPESYGDFEIPEGAVVQPELMAEFKQTMADEGFSKEAAQKVINLRAKQLQQEGEAWKTVRTAWLDELKTDKEFGGPKFTATCHNANMALRKFDPDGSALKALQASKYDNCPAIIRMLARVNAAVGEDSVHTGKENDKIPTKPLHERLWKEEDMGGK